MQCPTVLKTELQGFGFWKRKKHCQESVIWSSRKIASLELKEVTEAKYFLWEGKLHKHGLNGSHSWSERSMDDFRREDNIKILFLVQG